MWPLYLCMYYELMLEVGSPVDPGLKLQYENGLKSSWLLYHSSLQLRAWVSTGATGAWHPRNFWTVLSSTRWLWQFYYITLWFTQRYYNKELKICDDRRFVVTAPALPYCRFLTISGHFFDNYLYIFDKTEVQTVILRCWTSLNLNWHPLFQIHNSSPAL